MEQKTSLVTSCNASEAAKEYYQTIHDIHQLDGIRALLDWDQQVYMPEAGALTKANQLEYVAVLMHQKMTDAQFEKNARRLLEESATNTSSPDFINAANSIKQIEREKKLSAEFVAQKTRLHSQTFQLWQKAKSENSFSLVQKNLAQVFDLAKQEAHFVGFSENVYDALLDQYEPDGRVAWVEPLLVSLADELKVFLARRKLAADAASKVAAPLVAMPIHVQKKLCEHLMVAFGLPASASRLDISSHPFCTTIGHDDVRITSRFRSEDFLYGLGSLLHELGHALYEYHLPQNFRGAACGSVYSLGMHESQSRFIENCIGRSVGFSQYLSGVCRDQFATEVSAALIYAQQNHVAPSLIRVDADEVTYLLHIVIRMLLEIDLLNGDLPIADLPAAWNDLYQKYLSIAPKTDQEGILQDVHWYSGAIGYFPTYALGNIYDGLLLDAIKIQLPDFDDLVQQGNFQPITNWLRMNVHEHASRQTSRVLMQSITGKDLSSEPFVRYIAGKLT